VNGKRKADPTTSNQEPKEKIRKHDPVKTESQTQLTFPDYYSNLR
jgi:hypothetical protein